VIGNVMPPVALDVQLQARPFMREVCHARS
jgi:hypothetical protein